MPRFKLGERVALNGLLGELHGGEAIGTVVLVVPDRHGLDVFDEYGIAFEDSRQLRVRSFQLTHVVLTDADSQEKAASLGLPGDLTRKNQFRCPTRMNHDYRGRT